MKIVIGLLFMMWLGGGCTLPRLGKAEQSPSAARDRATAYAAARMKVFDEALAKAMAVPAPRTEAQLASFKYMMTIGRCDARTSSWSGPMLTAEQRAALTDECRVKYHAWLHERWTGVTTAAIDRGEGGTAHDAAMKLAELVQHTTWRGPKAPPVDLLRRSATARAAEEAAAFARDGTYAAGGKPTCVAADAALPRTGKLPTSYHFSGGQTVRLRCYLGRTVRELTAGLERVRWSGYATLLGQGKGWPMEITVADDRDHVDLELALAGRLTGKLGALQLEAAFEYVAGTEERWDAARGALVRTPLVKREPFWVIVSVAAL